MSRPPLAYTSMVATDANTRIVTSGKSAWINVVSAGVATDIWPDIDPDYACTVFNTLDAIDAWLSDCQHLVYEKRQELIDDIEVQS